MASKPEERLALHIWEAVRENLTPSRRTECAEGILRALEEYGMDASELAGLQDEDEDLKDAYETVFGVAEEEEEEGGDLDEWED